VVVYPFTQRVSLAAFSSFLALLLGWFCRPILHKGRPVILIDVLWLIIFPLLGANPFTNRSPCFLLPESIDQVIKLLLPVEILLQKKNNTVSVIFFFNTIQLVLSKKNFTG